MMFATVPIRCMSIGAGPTTSGLGCIRMPTCRWSRTACCAAAIERWRPMVIGITRLGNRTTLRTGTMMRASGGKGGIGEGARLALSSDVLRKRVSVTERSCFLQRHEEASVGYSVADRAVAPRRKPHAALEPALRKLETMNDGRAQLAG